MLIDCREKQEMAKVEIASAIREQGIRPTLTIIQVGDDPASNRYINQKIAHGQNVGISVVHIKLEEWTLTNDLIAVIEDEQSHADGLIVQLPLPKHINVEKVFAAIDPMKDVDCLTLENQGLLYAGCPRFEPCTPQGVIEALKDHVTWEGANVLIIGRSEIVGKPLSQMLTQRNATVTLAHSKTKGLDQMITSGKYDVIVSAVGRPREFTANAYMLVDVGINFDKDGKMCGDFDLEKCRYELATPVPNGIGRMTIVGLLRNTLKAYYINN